MNIHVVVAVRDSAVGSFAQPFLVPATAVAVRSFQDEVRRSESPMAAHPEDYELYQVATFDDETGQFVNQEPPARLVRAKDLALTQ